METGPRVVKPPVHPETGAYEITHVFFKDLPSEFTIKVDYRKATITIYPTKIKSKLRIKGYIMMTSTGLYGELKVMAKKRDIRDLGGFIEALVGLIDAYLNNNYIDRDLVDTLIDEIEIDKDDALDYHYAYRADNERVNVRVW